MRSATVHAAALSRRLAEEGCVIMLDFDGTLAPIVPHHGRARLSPALRKTLTRLAKRYPVAVISGRSLEDVRSRVRIPGISYAGSHGLETHMVHAHAPISVTLPPTTRSIFERAKRALRALSVRHQRVRVEDKGMSFALHYRRLGKREAVEFVREADAVLAPLIKTGSIRVINDLSTYDLMPHSARTKGHCAEEMVLALRRTQGVLPLYIGDGLTDEDAFRVLRHGVTIRVGSSRTSEAQYYFKSRTEVDRFLRTMLAIMPSDRKRSHL